MGCSLEFFGEIEMGQLTAFMSVSVWLITRALNILLFFWFCLIIELFFCNLPSLEI